MCVWMSEWNRWLLSRDSHFSVSCARPMNCFIVNRITTAFVHNECVSIVDKYFSLNYFIIYYQKWFWHQTESKSMHFAFDSAADLCIKQLNKMTEQIFVVHLFEHLCALVIVCVCVWVSLATIWCVVI